MSPKRSPISKARPVPSPASISQVERRAKELIRHQAPDLRRESHWGQPWYVGVDLVCLVGSFTHHVGVEFWRGSTLPDPDHMLEGTGKNLRHVKLRTLEEAASPKLVRLLRAAVDLDLRLPRRTR